MSEQIKKKSGFRWFVLALIFCIYMIAGADRSNIGMVVPYIQESFHMSNTDIGAMATSSILPMPLYRFRRATCTANGACASCIPCRLC